MDLIGGWMIESIGWQVSFARERKDSPLENPEPSHAKKLPDSPGRGTDDSRHVAGHLRFGRGAAVR